MSLIPLIDSFFPFFSFLVRLYVFQELPKGNGIKNTNKTNQRKAGLQSDDDSHAMKITIYPTGEGDTHEYFRQGN